MKTTLLFLLLALSGCSNKLSNLAGGEVVVSDLDSRTVMLEMQPSSHASDDYGSIEVSFDDGTGALEGTTFQPALKPQSAGFDPLGRSRGGGGNAVKPLRYARPQLGNVDFRVVATDGDEELVFAGHIVLWSQDKTEVRKGGRFTITSDVELPEGVAKVSLTRSNAFLNATVISRDQFSITVEAPTIGLAMLDYLVEVSVDGHDVDTLTKRCDFSRCTRAGAWAVVKLMP